MTATRSSLPSSVWLALGACAAALCGPGAADRAGDRREAILLGVAIGLVGFTCFARAWGALRPGARSSPRRLTALAIGGAVVAMRLLAAGDPAGAQVLPDGVGPWTAVVEAMGSPHDGQQTATLGLEPSGSVRLAAILPRYPSIEPGDQIRVSGALQPPPDDDGYGAYLRRIGVAAMVRSRTLERVAVSTGPAGELESLRRGSGEALARALPEPEAGLAAGILIGLRDRVDRDLAAAFTTAGVSHVVAISGWNIAIVGAVVAAILRGRTGRRTRSAMTLAAIVGYTVLAGSSPSVVRAAVMALVVLLARESGRAGSAAVALGWAVMLLVAADPSTVNDPGFELSAVATGGLVAWGSRMTERLRSLRGGMLPPWLAESLGVSLSAQAATLPIALAQFGRLALVAPVVNLAVVPLVPLAMAGGVIALVGGWLTVLGLPPLLGSVLALPGWLVLTMMVAIVRGAASLPLASLILPPPWNLALAAIVAAVVLASAFGWLRRPRGAVISQRGARPKARRAMQHLNRRTRFLATVGVMTLALLGVAAANRPDGLVHVSVLDVGQGDAILVEGGRGGRLLIDGGPDPDRLLVVLDARIPPWDRRIDLVILTHPHEDHVAGLALLLDRYRIGRIFEPGMIGPGPGYRAWRLALERLHLQPAPLSTGDRFGLDGIDFRVLWPDSGSVPREPADSGTAINNVSIVLLGTFGRERFLLAGDIEEGIDPTLVARGLPTVDLLKLAHHGSRTSSTEAMLKALHPRVAIASAGAGNPYGHPAPATLARAATGGARVLRTDRDGTVEAILDGVRRLEIRTEPGATLPPSPRPVTNAVTAAVMARAFSCGIPTASG